MTTKALPKARKIALEAIAKGSYKVALFLGVGEVEEYDEIDEISAPGYKAGGKPLPKLTVRDDGLWCSSPVVWAESSIEADAVLVYDVKTGEGVFFAKFPKQKSLRDDFKVDFSGNPLFQLH
jgi:hypothetical protein